VLVLLSCAARHPFDVPVSEKKVEKPWSSLAALRSSVRKPSGCRKSACSSMVCVQCLSDSPGCRARGSTAISPSCQHRSPEAATFPRCLFPPHGISCHAIPSQALSGAGLTSQQLFAIWQPAWPTRRVQSQHEVACFIPCRRSGQGAWAALGIGVNIPFKLMTSRMFAEWLCVDW
jgi:hypothetical protein